MIPRVKFVTAALLATATGLSLFFAPARAQEDAPRPRLFAELTGGDCIDWEAEDSQALVLKSVVFNENGQPTATIQFGEPDEIVWFPSDFWLLDDEGNFLLDLAGTCWVGGPVLHITADGIQEVKQVYWLEEEDSKPVAGLVANTGPDGEVWPVGAAGLARLGDDSYRLTYTGNELSRFCVNAGLFQR